jgi:ATP-dependent Lhr-like helicase
VEDVDLMLAKPIREAARRRGFTRLTEPQRKAIPLILGGSNVLLIAPSGSGKTEAALLPIFSMLIASPRTQGIKILYITPLRALNRDLLERIEWWAHTLDLRVAVRHGDTEASERVKQSLAPPDILITTPETLQAILAGKILRRHLQSLRWVVVDEVHELADNKRGCQLSIALERLRMIIGRDFQIIGLSATIGSPERVASFLTGSRKCEIVKVPVARMIDLSIIYPKPSIEDFKLSEKLITFPEVVARLRVMRELIEKHRSTLIFTNTRSIAEILASRFKMWDLNIPISIHHGSLSKYSRLNVEAELKRGVLKGVVCTSSLELGIDVGSIDLVIQYNSPRQATRLIQRVCRSGHWLELIAKGVVICMDSDDLLESIVISRKALNEELEEIEVPKSPLDVLTHQLAGLLIYRGRWGIDELLNLLRNAYPYRGLSREELLSVLQYMANRKPPLARLAEDNVQRPRPIVGLYQYYFSKLSMIPEERQFLAVDEERNMPVGLLDEVFVAEYGDPGAKIILAGQPWRILYIHEDKIYLKPEEDPSGAIPSWAGEEIPVPFSIAMEVGFIRRLVEEKVKEGFPRSKIVDLIVEKYPATRDVVEEGLREVFEQIEDGYPIPTDRRLTIENWGEYIILNCTFGLLINRTLGRLLAYILANRFGFSIGVYQDPYRIILRAPSILGDDVLKAINELVNSQIDQLAIEAVSRTGLFKRRLIHVARRFGAIGEEADLSRVGFDKLMEGFRGTVIFNEALKEALSSDFDVDGLKNVVEMIKNKTVEIAILRNRESPTPISRIGILELTWKTDIVQPKRIRKLLIEAVKARILNEKRCIACVECWRYVEEIYIKNLPHDLACPECRSKNLGLVENPIDEVQEVMDKIASSQKLTLRDGRIKRKLIKTSKLVASYGRTAAIVLSSHISIPDAEKLLEEINVENNSLYEKILEYERRRLWFTTELRGKASIN